MGCTKSSITNSTIRIKQIKTPSNEIDKVRIYYQQNEFMISNRVRELFEKYFNKQTDEPLVIDLKFINLSGMLFKPLEIVLPCFKDIKGINL